MMKSISLRTFRCAMLSICLGLLTACSSTNKTPKNNIPASDWVDVDKSVEKLDRIWAGGDPHESDFAKLEQEALKAPVQVYGKVVKQLRMNPPSVWRNDIRLINYSVIGFELLVHKVTAGVTHSNETLKRGSVIRVYMRVKRQRHEFSPAETIATKAKIWLSYDRIPAADANVFEDAGVVPRMWTNDLNAGRLGKAMP